MRNINKCENCNKICADFGIKLLAKEKEDELFYCSHECYSSVLDEFMNYKKEMRLKDNESRRV